MTIHSSKGLEFKHVFLVGVEENLFPSQMSLNSRSELEEERRLFYVAVTRAEKSCTISYATSRFIMGSINSCEPSRFLSEINPAYIKQENAYGSRPGGRSLNSGSVSEPKFTGGLNRIAQPTRNLRSLSDLQSSGKKSDDNSELKVGYNVLHERFGKGKIVKIEGQGEDKKATIFFPKEGSKTLLLRFAQLEIVD
jgi:DNA helicase II / ATP-dependent DNA helicase PcrA